MIKALKVLVVFVLSTCAGGCRHEALRYTVFDWNAGKALYSITSALDTDPFWGQMFYNKNDRTREFYTEEASRDCTCIYIRCYDYETGHKWTRAIPYISYNFLCVGLQVYVGGNPHVRALDMRYDSADTCGGIGMFDLGRSRPFPEIIIPPGQMKDWCKEIATYEEDLVIFLFGSDDCGYEFSSYVIFDPKRREVVEKGCFADAESRFRVLAKCARRVGRGYPTGSGKYHKRITDKGCLFYDNDFHLISEISAEEIEKHFLLLGASNEAFEVKRRMNEYFTDSIRHYGCEFVQEERVVFWNIYGPWFVYDIPSNEIVDSGVMNLGKDELLSQFVALNCFMVHGKASLLSQFLSWNFREDVYELVFINGAVQKRKRFPGLRRVLKLADGIVCLNFSG